MTTCYLAPDPIQSTQFVPGGNTPANGGQLFFYIAGTSTKQTVYKDSGAAVAWSNPIVLDSGGNLPSGGEVWFTQGIAYKVVFAPATDSDPPTSPYWSKDNLSGINDVATSVLEWIAASAPSYVSATQFSVVGDQRSIYQSKRRVQTVNSGGTGYQTVTSSAFSAGSTQVWVDFTGSIALDNGLSAVNYGILSASNVSLPPGISDAAATTMAASASTNIWAAGGNYLHISGTTPIGNFGTAQRIGQTVRLVFDSATPINSSASMLLPGFANLTTAPNDSMLVAADSLSIARVMQYSAANALPGKRPTLTSLGAAFGNTSGTYIPPVGTILLHGKMSGGGAGGCGAPTDGPTAATNGSSTTFGSLTAFGGSSGTLFVGGNGGGVTTSYSGYGTRGGRGSGGGQSSVLNTLMSGGTGGVNLLGGAGGGGAGNSAGTDAIPNTGAGGGGAGAGNSQNAGGGGGAGGYIEFYISVPATTSFAYTVGAGGSSGVSTVSGGLGATGVILLEEHYT